MSVNTEAFTYDWAQKWNWKVEIDGYERAFFNTIERPKMEYEVVEVNAGGTHRAVKVPGRATFQPIQAERGVLIVNDPDFIARLERMQEFANGGGGSFEDFIWPSIDIVEYDHADRELTRWRLFGAWISGFDGGNLDGSASEQTVETLTFQFQYFKKNPGRASSGGRPRTGGGGLPT